MQPLRFIVRCGTCLAIAATTFACTNRLPPENRAAPPRFPAEVAGDRPRARDIGIEIGDHPVGALDAITDVAGVRVGHTTLIRGAGKLIPGLGPVRTGVTVILPHGGDLLHERVPAAGFVMNGNGEMTGLSWINERGALEAPIVLTNTLNVPRAADAVISWMLSSHRSVGVSGGLVLPVVTECDDSALNDARGRHVTEADVLSALRDARGGPVAEGSVGAGTGMIAYEFKGGIGTASRVLPPEDGRSTVGVLVNANNGRRHELAIAGVPVGKEIPEWPAPFSTERSIIVVVATDAPLDSRQLGRLAKRAVLGVARTGAAVRHGSGDFILAFSTAQRVPANPEQPTRLVTAMSDDHMNPLFEAVAEATEEAIVNALLRATTVTGRDGNTAVALPIDRLFEAFRKHGRPLL